MISSDRDHTRLPKLSIQVAEVSELSLVECDLFLDFLNIVLFTHLIIKLK